jgi:hydroxypyruvate isomerase
MSRSGISRGRLSRRDFVVSSAVSAAAFVSAGEAVSGAAAEGSKVVTKGKIKQSACGGCFRRMSTEERAKIGAEMGLVGLDFVGPEEWPILKKYGLVCTLSGSHGLTKGLNHTENHTECLAAIRKSVDRTAEAGFRNVICFSGNRNGMDDDEGMKNCETALKEIVGYAEKKKVTLCMELLNSKVNHKDYMCDRSAWGFELAKKVGSPNFKMLYDIYHMQVQEGDIIATIRKNIDYIGHFHTAGVPGRHELDENQELNYPAIMRAIAETSYDGYVAHEYSPVRDPLVSLRQAVSLCDV